MHLNNPLVQQRIGQTLGYFTGACGLTGYIMYAARNSQRALSMNPWLLFALSLGTMFGTKMLDYE